MATVTDFIQVSTNGLLASAGGLWVRLLNNDTGTNYYSTLVTDANTGAFTVTAPPGKYSIYTGTGATVIGTPTLRDSNYIVPLSYGDDAKVNTISSGGGRPWFDITHPTFGADPTGVSDSHAAIAAALTACTAAGGGTVFVPPGTFLNSAVLTVPSNCSLIGAGTASVISATATKIVMLQTSSGGGTSKVSIRNLWVKNSGADAADTATMIKLQQGSDFEVVGCTVTGGRYGVVLLDVVRGRIAGCTISDQNGVFLPGGIEVVTTGAGHHCTVENNYVHDNGGFGMYIFSDTSTQTDLWWRISGNLVDTAADNGIRVQTNPNLTTQGGYIIANNIVTDFHADQIRVNGCRASITGNTCLAITQGQGGIRDTGDSVLTRSTISGNTCVNTFAPDTSGGIQLHGLGTSGNAERVVISGNYVEGWLQGIDIGKNGTCKNFSITGNVASNNGGDGIFLEGTTNATVSGNVCMNNGQTTAGRAGLNLNSTCTLVVLTGNLCFDDQGVPTQNYGIRVASGTDSVFGSNNVCYGNIAAQISMGGSIPNSQWLNNVGMPASATSPSVGASPYTYTNNDGRPEDAVVFGGTVSKIEYAVNGSSFSDTGLITGQFYVDPLAALKITYTVAPTVKVYQRK